MTFETRVLLSAIFFTVFAAGSGVARANSIDSEFTGAGQNGRFQLSATDNFGIDTSLSDALTTNRLGLAMLARNISDSTNSILANQGNWKSLNLNRYSPDKVHVNKGHHRGHSDGVISLAVTNGVPDSGNTLMLLSGALAVFALYRATLVRRKTVGR